MTESKRNSIITGTLIFVIVVLCIIVTVLIISSRNTYANGKNSEYMFTVIKVDNSGTLNVNRPIDKYYYLNDTGIVYAGNYLVNNVSQSYGIPVISSSGHYLKYNTETESVEEVE